MLKTKKRQIEVIKADGTSMRFESLSQAESLKIPRPTIRRSLHSGLPVKRGKFKGCIFKYCNPEEFNNEIKLRNRKMRDSEKAHLYQRLKELKQQESDELDLEFAEPDEEILPVEEIEVKSIENEPSTPSPQAIEAAKEFEKLFDVNYQPNPDKDSFAKADFN